MENKAVFVLLAGGQSSRMGVAKGLLKFKQTFWLVEQLERISKSNCSEVVLGLGYNFEHYFMALPWLETAQTTAFSFLNLKLTVVVNPTPENGQFSTLQACLKKVNHAENILISPIDTPIDTPTYLNSLLATSKDLVQLCYEGKNGHPIKISEKIRKELVELPISDEEARLDVQLKKTTPENSAQIATINRDCIINFNTPSEWKSYVASIS